MIYKLLHIIGVHRHKWSVINIIVIGIKDGGSNWNTEYSCLLCHKKKIKTERI